MDAGYTYPTKLYLRDVSEKSVSSGPFPLFGWLGPLWIFPRGLEQKSDSESCISVPISSEILIFQAFSTTLDYFMYALVILIGLPCMFILNRWFRLGSFSSRTMRLQKKLMLAWGSMIILQAFFVFPQFIFWLSHFIPPIPGVNIAVILTTVGIELERKRGQFSRSLRVLSIGLFRSVVLLSISH